MLCYQSNYTHDHEHEIIALIIINAFSLLFIYMLIGKGSIVKCLPISKKENLSRRKLVSMVCVHILT